MVAIWGRLFTKQSDKSEQAIEEQQSTQQSLSDRLKIYRKFNLEVQEERGGYSNSSAYPSAPRTRRIPRYF